MFVNILDGKQTKTTNKQTCKMQGKWCWKELATRPVIQATWKAETGRLQVKICLDNGASSRLAWVM